MPVTIYPNPATNTLTVQTANSNYNKLKIIDLTRRIEMSQEINSINTVVDISNLAPALILLNSLQKMERKRFSDL